MYECIIVLQVCGYRLSYMNFIVQYSTVLVRLPGYWVKIFVQRMNTVVFRHKGSIAVFKLHLN